MRTFLVSCAVAGALVPLTAKGDFDVSPAVESGKIVTNAYADADGTTIGNVRVFTFEFGEDPLDPYFLEDPGFHPLPGGGFAGGVTLSAGAFSPLSFWTGSTFGALPAGETMEVTRGSTTITLGNSGFAGSVAIETTDASGEFDEHLSSMLKGVTPTPPSAGIYLFSATLSASGLTNSDPVYFIFGNGADEADFESAALYVRDTFAPGSTLVPEPAAMALLPLIGIMMRRRIR